MGCLDGCLLLMCPVGLFDGRLFGDNSNVLYSGEVLMGCLDGCLQLMCLVGLFDGKLFGDNSNFCTQERVSFDRMS